MNLKFSLGLIALWLAMAFGQNTECTQELVMSDDCAAVINPNACYNQFRWNTRTLTCIEGENDADRARKACKCCSCVGTVMCNWVTQNRYCDTAAAGKGKKGKARRRAAALRPNF